MFTMGGPIRSRLPNLGSLTMLSNTDLWIQRRVSYEHPSTYLHRSSDTGKGTSRRYPGPQKSPPGPRCTPACCSRPVGRPQRLGQEMVAGPLLEQSSQDSDPYSFGCSYSPWGAPGTAGQPPTQWPAHCCAPAGSPWCSLAWLQWRSSFRSSAVKSKRRAWGDWLEGDQEEVGRSCACFLNLWREKTDRKCRSWGMTKVLFSA